MKLSLNLTFPAAVLMAIGLIHKEAHSGGLCDCYVYNQDYGWLRAEERCATDTGNCEDQCGVEYVLGAKVSNSKDSKYYEPKEGQACYRNPHGEAYWVYGDNPIKNYKSCMSSKAGRCCDHLTREQACSAEIQNYPNNPCPCN